MLDFTCINLPYKSFEGIFEIIPTPPVGTGWAPEFSSYLKYPEGTLWIPLVEYYNSISIKFSTLKSKDKWEKVKKCQDILYESIVRKIRQDMDKLVGKKGRMGGYIDEAFFCVPENTLGLWIENDFRHRQFIFTLTATVGACVL